MIWYYIAGEVDGGDSQEERFAKRRTGIVALVLVGLFLGGVLGLTGFADFQLVAALPFLAILARQVLQALLAA